MSVLKFNQYLILEQGTDSCPVATKKGYSFSDLKQEYIKGLGAFYSSGSRPGMSAHQWAMARVNSASPSKSWANVKKVKG